jgi:hypothetical protein
MARNAGAAWAALVLTVAAVAESTAAQPDAVAAELIQLERDYCTAQINRDADFFIRTLDENYTQIGSRGTVQGKADVLAGLKDVDTTAASCAQSNVRVRVYADAAVVTGQTIAAGVYKGVPYTGRQVLWTDTFIRQGQYWRLVATQSTAVAVPSK